MQIIALINTTIRPLHLTKEEAIQLRDSGAPENEWRGVIEKGKPYEVPEEIGLAWIRLGIAKAADGSKSPSPEVAAKADAANNGQAAENPALNLQHPELAADGQNAVAARVRSLNAAARTAATAEPSAS